MKNLWYKSWLETRFRFWVAMTLLLPVGFLAWAMLGAAARQPAATKLWPLYLSAVFVLIAPFVALILAGSGLNTQTVYGLTRGFHGSMLYTLSLPVRRRDLLWTRASLGLAGFLLFLMLAIACLPAVALAQGVLLSGAGVNWGYVALLGVFIYSLALVPSALLDEFWGGMVGFGVIAFGLGLLAGLGRIRTVEVMGSGWHPGVVTGIVLVSAACWLVSAWAVERTEV